MVSSILSSNHQRVQPHGLRPFSLGQPISATRASVIARDFLGRRAHGAGDFAERPLAVITNHERQKRGKG